MTEVVTADVFEMALKAKSAAAVIASFSSEKRLNSLLHVADQLARHEPTILAANEDDQKEAKELVDRGQLTTSMYERLKLDQEKLKGLVKGIVQIAHSKDPLQDITLSRQLDDDLHLYRVSVPIGVVLVIFESRPDALPQILSLLIKSGNAALIKGGKEAKRSNQALFQCIWQALVETGFPESAFSMLSTREQVNELLSHERIVDLVVPRGSNELVRQIQSSTRIPVLGHADGVCHLFVDESADLDMASDLAIDAKAQYPAACNSMETLLVHKNIAERFLPTLITEFTGRNVELRVDPSAIRRFALKGVVEAREDDWSKEYCDLVLSIKVVDSLGAAIEHINRFGSGHTDSIVTSDRTSFERFFAEVNSASVFWNASTRFADGYRYGFGAEVGISTGKLHPRGPVGIEGLVTYKYKLIGNGHVVSTYVGPQAREFIHRDMKEE